MTENGPPNLGERASIHPSAGQWTPTYPAATAPRSRIWPAIAIAGIAAFVAVAALIVALMKPMSSNSSTTSTVARYSAADVAGAQRQLCDTYRVQARTVRADTNGNNEALARIAATNGAVMLFNAASNPALDSQHRDAARALATAYGNVSAMGSKGVATDAEWQAVLDEANAKDAVMKQVCGGA